MKILTMSPLRTSFWREDETASRFVTASAPVHHLEDFHPGDRFVTPEREVTEAEIVAFAREFDPQPFHTDPAAGAGSVFGRHVGSGWHTAALTMRMWVDHGPRVAGGMIGLGVEDLRWGRSSRATGSGWRRRSWRCAPPAAARPAAWSGSGS